MFPSSAVLGIASYRSSCSEATLRLQDLQTTGHGLTNLKLDHTDWEIVRLLDEDGRMSYSQISKTIGVSIGTVRNRINALRESGALHLNVWVDPYRVGLGIAATLLIRLEAGTLDAVVAEMTELDSTGYIAVIAGDHDLMVDVFCRDVPHLDDELRNQVETIEGVRSVTSYLVTQIRYDSKTNLASLLGDSDTASRDRLRTTDEVGRTAS